MGHVVGGAHHRLHRPAWLGQQAEEAVVAFTGWSCRGYHDHGSLCGLDRVGDRLREDRKDGLDRRGERLREEREADTVLGPVPSTESLVLLTAAGSWRTGRAGRTCAVHRSREEVPSLAVVADHQPRQEPPAHVLREAAA